MLIIKASLVAKLVIDAPANAGVSGLILVQDDPLEKGMAAYLQ